MPHVTVKLYPGKSEEQKKELAEAITRDVMKAFHYGEESVSVSMEEVPAKDWLVKVYQPEILGKPKNLYKKPGYAPEDLR